VQTEIGMAYFDEASSSKSQYDVDGNKVKRVRKDRDAGPRSVADRSTANLRDGAGDSSTALGTR
jgi:hypothetical protein